MDRSGLVPIKAPVGAFPSLRDIMIETPYVGIESFATVICVTGAITLVLFT